MSSLMVGVNDGDTIVVWDGKQQITISLDGIDAPEHNQAFGNRQKSSLRQWFL